MYERLELARPKLVSNHEDNEAERAAGARPRAAASVVAALTGTRANDLYTGLTGRAPRE